jgi:hypothetical protein
MNRLYYLHGKSGPQFGSFSEVVFHALAAHAMLMLICDCNALDAETINESRLIYFQNNNWQSSCVWQSTGPGVLGTRRDVTQLGANEAAYKLNK